MRKKSSFIVISIVLLTLLGCGQHPRVDAVPEIRDNRIFFVLSTKDINRLLGFKVQDDSGRLLWDLGFSYEKIQEIEYGVLPITSGSVAPRQVFPPEDEPPENIRGKTVIVSIEYQYDSIVARSGTFKKTLKIP
jgi:hypothetical protein